MLDYWPEFDNNWLKALLILSVGTAESLVIRSFGHIVQLWDIWDEVTGVNK